MYRKPRTNWLIFAISKLVVFVLIHVQAYATENVAGGEDCTRILAIKSQGNRTIIPIRILQHLEKELCDDFKEGESIRIAEPFDIMSGSYTGTFLPIALSIPGKDNNKYKYKASDLYKQFHGAFSQIEIKEPPATSWWVLDTPEKIGPVIVAGFIGYHYIPPHIKIYIGIAGVLTIVCAIGYKHLIKPNAGETYDQKMLSNVHSKLKDICDGKDLSESTKHILIPAYAQGSTVEYIFDSIDAKKSLHKNYMCEDILKTCWCNNIVKPQSIKDKDGGSRTFYSEASPDDQKKRGATVLSNPSTLSLKKAEDLKGSGKNTFLLYINTEMSEHEATFHSHHQKAGNQQIIHLIIKPETLCNQTINVWDSQDSQLSLLRNAADDFWDKNKEKKEIRCILAHLTEYWIEKKLTYKSGNEKLLKLRIDAGIYGGDTKVSLTKLSIKSQHLDFVNDRAQAISQTVTELDLSSNDIDYEGVPKLGDILQQCKHIKSLKLDSNKIMDPGLKRICDIFLLNLKILSLKTCGISDAGYLELFSFMKSKERASIPLPIIYIKGNNIENATLLSKAHDHINSRD